VAQPAQWTVALARRLSADDLVQVLMTSGEVGDGRRRVTGDHRRRAGKVDDEILVLLLHVSTVETYYMPV